MPSGRHPAMTVCLLVFFLAACRTKPKQPENQKAKGKNIWPRPVARVKPISSATPAWPQSNQSSMNQL